MYSWQTDSWQAKSCKHSWQVGSWQAKLWSKTDRQTVGKLSCGCTANRLVASRLSDSYVQLTDWWLAQMAASRLVFNMLKEGKDKNNILELFRRKATSTDCFACQSIHSSVIAHRSSGCATTTLIYLFTVFRNFFLYVKLKKLELISIIFSVIFF